MTLEILKLKIYKNMSMTPEEWKKEDCKHNIKLTFQIICFIILLWISITSTICAFKNPEMTETQLFLHIPKSFILDFN